MIDDASSVKTPRSFDWIWIFKTLLLRKEQAASILGLAIIAYAVGLAFPIATQKIVDEIVSGQVSVNTVSWALIALAAILIEGIVFFLRQKLIIELAAFLDRRVSRRAFTHLMRVRIDGTQFRSGDIINHFQQATKIRDFVLYQIPSLIIDSGGAIIALILAIYYDHVVGLALLICAPLMMIFAGRQVGAARTYSEKFYKSVGKRQNILSETINSISTIRSSALEISSLHRWSTATELMLSHLRTVMSLGRNFMLRAQIASKMMTFIVISLGCVRIFYGHLSVGELLALQILAGRITGPILASGDAYRIWQGVDVAIKQIKDFLSIPIERSNIKTPIRTLGLGSIKFTNVSLKYPGRQNFALSNVSFKLPEKGFIAIVGKNGSGKSSLLRILLGLSRDFSGLVEISNHNILDYDPRWLRGQIGTVDQDITLFTGTVRENICGTKQKDENLLKSALAFAGALEFVEELPEGLDNELSENGRSLSGGQRQRLSIARAVIRDPVLAILDEPTAFLDPEAALAMEKNLSAWGRSRLLILVTHHLGAIKEADTIIVLDRGHVVGIGRHDDLIDQCNVYESLWSDYDRSSSRY